MRLFDWRYKGLRIHRKYLKLHTNYVVGMYTILLLSFLSYSFFYLDIWKGDIIYKGLLFFALMAISAVASVFLWFLFYPLSRRLLFLQRGCQMLYDSKFYIVNNFVVDNMMTTDEEKIKREIIYFPRAYIKLARKVFSFTIQLDGSAFHRSGDYEDLAGVLEQRFGLDLSDMLEKNSYLTYVFSDNRKNRLMIEDVKVENTKITLMKNIVWDIEKVAHALVVGATGGGKTYFLQILIQAFAKMGADIRIGDPKNSDLSDCSKVYRDVNVNKDDIVEMIDRAVSDMDIRYAELKKLPNYSAGHSFSFYELQPIFLIIDEYVAFLSNISKKADRDKVVNKLRQIILKGRQVGVFVVLATQRPDAKFLEGDIRDQLGLRVSIGRMEADGYRMIFEGERELRNKDESGRGYIKMGGLTLVKEFYSPLVPLNYPFIDKLRQIVVESQGEFVALAKNSSTVDEYNDTERSEERKE